MAFGLPGTDTGSGANGEFLGRINCDARSGAWTITRRVQDKDGGWSNESSSPFFGPTFLMDFGSLEVGWMKIATPPSFLLAPMGKPVPPQPEEMAPMRPGDKQARRAYQQGFRLKVMSQKTFGDMEPYYFSATSKTVMGAVEALWNLFCVSPEAWDGKVPVVAVTGADKVQVKTPQGTNTFHAPIFNINTWVDRPAGLGERTVPPPAPRAGATSAPAPAAHVPPPAPVEAPQPQPQPQTAGGLMF